MNTVSERTFTVPTKAEVSESNQAIFDNLEKGLGFVPNLYAYYAKNETALHPYLHHYYLQCFTDAFGMCLVLNINVR